MQITKGNELAVYPEVIDVNTPIIIPHPTTGKLYKGVIGNLGIMTSFVALSGTTWNAATESNKRTKTISANTAITISNAPSNFEGLLEVTNSGSYTLTINGTSVMIKNSGTTMIGILNVGGTLKYYPESSGSTGGTTVTQLTAPTLTATAASISQINLSWNDVANESAYLLQRATDAGFTANLVTIANPVAGATSYNNTGLLDGTTYYYRLKAVGDGVLYADSPYTSANATTTARAYSTLEDMTFNNAAAMNGWTLTGGNGAVYAIQADGGANKAYQKTTTSSQTAQCFKDNIFTIGDVLKITLTGVNIVSGTGIKLRVGNPDSALAEFQQSLFTGTNTFIVNTAGFADNYVYFGINLVAGCEGYVGGIKIEKQL